jgi:hypothetical protein
LAVAFTKGIGSIKTAALSNVMETLVSSKTVVAPRPTSENVGQHKGSSFVSSGALWAVICACIGLCVAVVIVFLKMRGRKAVEKPISETEAEATTHWLHSASRETMDSIVFDCENPLFSSNDELTADESSLFGDEEKNE